MKRQEFLFRSADRKTDIHAVLWLPEGTPRAVVQISHGVSEYVLRYDNFARYLTGLGYAVVGNDHLGHGTSVAPGAPRIYFGPKGSWDFVVEDLYTLCRQTKLRFPGLPYVLMGHSMGSFLARTFLLRHPTAVDAAIIMGTGQMGSLLVQGGLLAAKLESLRVGEKKSSPLINALAFGPYNKPFAPNRTDFDWLSLAEENVDRYLADPHCGEPSTVGLFREMLSGIALITKAGNLKQMRPATPILFISGEMDPVGDCGKGVRKAYESFRAAGMQDVTLRLYPQLRHEILQEACRQTVYEDIAAWLEEKTTA